jgi:hypothetical protein
MSAKYLPPPQIQLKAYIEQLRASAEQMASSVQLQRGKPVVAYEPLERQIDRWWVNLPPAMQNRRFQIAEIAAQCRGRYRDKAAIREVAAALRVLGWRELSDWTSAGRNKRFWVP